MSIKWSKTFAFPALTMHEPLQHVAYIAVQNNSSAIAEMGDRLATIDMGRWKKNQNLSKLWVAIVLFD